MESMLRKTLLRQDEPPHPLILSIRDVCDRLQAAESRFSVESDPDRIESCIYEMKALRAEYRYLLRTARQQGITCREQAHLWNE